jgi:hypothetical protein
MPAARQVVQLVAEIAIAAQSVDEQMDAEGKETHDHGGGDRSRRYPHALSIVHGPCIVVVGRRVDTSACHRETWINTAEGWRLRLIDNVQSLVWSVDGKRVDSSKTYDPDAPAYAPDVEVTSPCTD